MRPVMRELRIWLLSVALAIVSGKSLFLQIGMIAGKGEFRERAMAGKKPFVLRIDASSLYADSPELKWKGDEVIYRGTYYELTRIARYGDAVYLVLYADKRETGLNESLSKSGPGADPTVAPVSCDDDPFSYQSALTFTGYYQVMADETSPEANFPEGSPRSLYKPPADELQS
jgi:hypothetical protein